MFTVERDLTGFVEIHEDGRRIALINQRERSLEDDAAVAEQLVGTLNASTKGRR